MKQISKIFCLSVLISLCVFTYAYSLDLSTKYFEVDIDDDIDLYKLVRRLDVFGSVSISSSNESSGLSRVLANELDSMYSDVSDILDIHMYKNTIGLRIFSDRRGVERILSKHYSGNPSSPSFFDANKRIIYISFADMTPNMLAHEVAHAIISKYFVVPPSQKVQEILAGYVDFKIQKK